MIVNPASVYGPSPPRSYSFDASFMRPLVRGLLPLLPPGGFGVVLTEGLAARAAAGGQAWPRRRRYILCDRHVSLRELAETIVRLAWRGRVPPTTPLPLAHALGAAGEAAARLLRRPPPLARGQLEFLLWNAEPVSAKAQTEGWQPTPLEDGIRSSLAALGLLNTQRAGAA